MTTEIHNIYDGSHSIPFQHQKYLGRGSYGTVDAVTRTFAIGEHRYARKTFIFPRKPKQRELNRILQEIEIARNLQHIHIVRLVETYQAEHTYAMIMQPVADGNLESYLSDLDDDDEHMDNGRRAHVSQWFGCLINALAFLHARRIVHGDIKPQNILTVQGNILLTDFGLSREFQEQTISETTEKRGTPRYRSSEEEDGRRAYFLVHSSLQK